jgi:hypothetical protein
VGMMRRVWPEVSLPAPFSPEVRVGRSQGTTKSRSLSLAPTELEETTD